MLGAEFWTPTRIFVLFIALQAAVNYDNGALPASLVTPSSESQSAHCGGQVHNTTNVTAAPSNDTCHFKCTTNDEWYKTLTTCSCLGTCENQCFCDNRRTGGYLVDDFGLTKGEEGMLGSFVYVGFVISSLAAGQLLQVYSPKMMLIAGIMLNNVANLLFTLATSKIVLLGARMMIGMTQSVLVCYSPVWVEEHAPPHLTGTWMSLLQAGVPIGIVLGYTITGLSLAGQPCYSWRWPFGLQVIIVAIMITLLALVPKDAIDPKKERTASVDRGSPSKMSTRPTNKDERKAGLLESADSSLSSISLDDSSVSGAAPITRTPSQIRVDTVGAHGGFATAWKQTKELCSNQLWMSLVFGLAALYFVVTSIQFWVTKYLVSTLGFPETSVTLAFSATSVTSPILGVLLGGMAIDRWLGGYSNTEGVLKVCSILAFLAVLTSIPLGLIETSLPAIIFLIWVLLFLGGAIVPAVTGLNVTIVPRSMKAYSAALSNTMYQLIGYAFAPFFTGIFSGWVEPEIIPGCGSKFNWGWRMCVWWSIFGLIFIVYAWYLARKEAHSHQNDHAVYELNNDDVKYENTRRSSMLIGFM